MKTPMTSKYFPPCDVSRVAKGANRNKALIPIRRYPHMQGKISCTVIQLCVLPLPTINLRHWHRPPTDGANLLTMQKQGKASHQRLLMNVCPAANRTFIIFTGGICRKMSAEGKKIIPSATFSGSEGEKRKSKSLTSRRLCEER